MSPPGGVSYLADPGIGENVNQIENPLEYPLANDTTFCNLAVNLHQELEPDEGTITVEVLRDGIVVPEFTIVYSGAGPNTGGVVMADSPGAFYAEGSFLDLRITTAGDVTMDRDISATLCECDGAASVIGARVSGPEQTILDDVITALTFDAERFDLGGDLFSPLAPTRLTAPEAGVYQIGGSVAWANVAAAGDRSLGIRLNGGVFIAGQTQPQSPGPMSTMQTISTTYRLDAGDYVELVAIQNSGVDIEISDTDALSPEFSLVRLG